MKEPVPDFGVFLIENNYSHPLLIKYTGGNSYINYNFDLNWFITFPTDSFSVIAQRLLSQTTQCQLTLIADQGKKIPTFNKLHRVLISFGKGNKARAFELWKELGTKGLVVKPCPEKAYTTTETKQYVIPLLYLDNYEVLSGKKIKAGFTQQ